MQIGAVFPQTKIGADLGAVRAFAQAASDLGYRHLLAYDHVLGADPAVHTGWRGPYAHRDPFHEPFVLFGYLAGWTDLEFATAVLVAPQRETALIAKQAAALDVLSGGGRLRLGLGIGWNQVEYEALGQSFSSRAARLEEQIELMRRLWTEEVVTFSGRFHTVTGAGIAPLPITRPIPLWLGALAPPSLRRVGRMADGWFPQTAPGRGLEEQLEIVAVGAREAGRDPGSIAMEGQVRWSADDPERVARHAETWRRAGASHLSVNSLLSDAGDVDEHIAILRSAAAVLFGN